MAEEKRDPDCLFCKVVAGDIPAERVYESEHVIGFRDINPQAPTHVLFIPKEHIPTINDIDEAHHALVGELFGAAKSVAASEGHAHDGYRVVMNCNEGAGQSVFHIHLHMLAGRRLTWPPG